LHCSLSASVVYYQPGIAIVSDVVGLWQHFQRKRIIGQWAGLHSPVGIRPVRGLSEVNWRATCLLVTGVCYGIDTVRNNWTFSISVTKLTVKKQKLQRLRVCWTVAVKCVRLGIIGSCWNRSGCDTYFIPRQLSGLWENFVSDDIARISVVAAHYAPNKLNLSSFLFSVLFNGKWATTWSLMRRWRDSGRYLFVCDVCWKDIFVESYVKCY